MDDETPFDPATRRLCPDGSCVGILDREGRCSECGQTGDPLSAEDDLALSVGGRGGVDPRSRSVRAQPAHEGLSEGFDPGRRLCDDGACVGVVGDDGTCHLCGRRAEG